MREKFQSLSAHNYTYQCIILKSFPYARNASGAHEQHNLDIVFYLSSNNSVIILTASPAAQCNEQCNSSPSSFISPARPTKLQCSRSCDAGWRRRRVECEGGPCDRLQRPAEFELCSQHQCPRAHWRISAWLQVIPSLIHLTILYSIPPLSLSSFLSYTRIIKEYRLCDCKCSQDVYSPLLVELRRNGMFDFSVQRRAAAAVCADERCGAVWTRRRR